MYEDIHGQIYDFHGGQADLARNHLRFVGDAHQRIKEDYLRQLRMIRFISKFGFQVDSETLSAVKTHLSGLRQISRERVTSELRKILAGSFLNEALLKMNETGMFQEIFNGFPNPTPELCAKISKLQSSQFNSQVLFEFRLAYLLTELSISASRSPIKVFLKSLKLSSDELKRVSGLMEFLELPTFQSRDQTMEFLDHLEDCKIPLDYLEHFYLSLQQVSPKGHWKELADFEMRYSSIRKARLPITGDDLIKGLNIKPGRDLGAILDGLKRAFRRGEWSSIEEGFSLARTISEGLKR
jgi:tRNA nucleotidyltransferase/poly(A) polymerase